MQFVYKPKRLRNGKQMRSRHYSGRYTVLDDPTRRNVALHTTDKQVAEQKLRAIVSETEREAVGLLAPRQMREGVQRSLVHHLAEFVADLEVRGRSSEYVRHIDARVKALMKACGWKRAADVSADSFVSWRGGKQASAKTLNDYLTAAGAFLNWLRDQGRISCNALASVRPVEARGRETFQRRALTVEECRKLVEVSGVRRVLYFVALTTGLRRGELAALRWDDVTLPPGAAFLTVRACTTKNRQVAEIPLRAEVAAELLATRPKGVELGALVFPGGIPRNRDLRGDFTKAGIPLVDGIGRKVDFHALRHTFCTLLHQSGASARVAMEAMRHSEMRLTMKVYTDASALPTRAAIEALPVFGDASPIASPSPGSTGLAVSPVDTMATPEEGAEVIGVEQVSRHLTLCDTVGHAMYLVEVGGVEPPIR